MPETVTGDAVEHPPHYTSHPSGIECIQITEHMDFCLGNAFKYLWRADLKTDNPIQDLEKAIWYIQRKIDLLKKQDKMRQLKAMQEVVEDTVRKMYAYDTYGR